MDVASPQPLAMAEMPVEEGLNIIKATFIEHSLTNTYKDSLDGDMSYVFETLEIQPFKNSWLTYLVTQNGLPSDSQLIQKQPLAATIEFELEGMHLLSSHLPTFTEQGEPRYLVDLTVPVDAANILLVRAKRNKFSLKYETTVH